MTVSRAIVAMGCLTVACCCACGESAAPALSVRGVNYYPRQTPWGGMWTRTPESVWDRDLALAAELHANTVRTFLPLAGPASHVQDDGAPTPLYLDRLNAFLGAAQRHGIRVILCFDAQPKSLALPDGPARARRALAAFVGNHRGDPRVRMWDLMNEPDDDGKWTDGMRAYLRDALATVRGLDTNHATTVGLTWRIDRLQEVGLPDVIQYHEYCPKQILFEKGPARVCQTIAHLRTAAGARPLLIGEFGLSTARDPVFGAASGLSGKMGAAPGTEAEQARLYETVLSAAEQARVAGTLAWCLYDYPISNPNESHFGLVRADGSLKPAALVLQRTYARWEKLQ